MASQEEVLDAIVSCGGCATLQHLKHIFGLAEVKGSSWLSQRLTAMLQKKTVRRIEVDGKAAYELIGIEVTPQTKETARIALKNELRGIKRSP